VYVRSGMRLTISALTNSRIKYRRISVYRENFWRTGFSLIAMHTGSSSKIAFTADCYSLVKLV